MKIKQKEKSPHLSRSIRDFFKNRRTLRASILGVGGLMLAGILFFGVLGYGAYLKKVGETTYYKHALLKIADLDFSFLKKYVQGQLSEYDNIKIDIKFKHMMRLQYLREQALEEGIIAEAFKEEEFPATLTYNGQEHDVKISLTGMMPMHVADPLKWSFEVKVKGDNTIRGMKRFGLLLPSTRGYLTDWLGMELMKERGLIGLRIDFVDVSINGKPKGVFYLEERFDKHLIEHNRLREGIIFKLDGALSPYQESKLMQNPETRDQLLMLKRMWQEVMAGNLEPGKFFDLEKMAKLFAVTDLMNNKHALYRTNLRFYFNPVTGLVEPIAREWGSLTKNQVANLSLFLEQPKLVSMHYELARDTVLRIIYDNLEFKRHYLREAEILSQKEFIDQLLIRNGGKLNALITNVYRDWPFYELPTHSLYANQEYMRSVLFSDMDLLCAYFHQEGDGYLTLYLKNQQDLPLEIFHLSVRDSTYFYPTDPVVLESNQAQFYQFQIPVNQNFADSLIPELKIHYNLLGLQTGQKTALVFPWPYEQRLEYAANPVVKEANFTSFAFIKEEEAQNEISIPAGKWTISRDLIIPEKKRFVVEAGAQVDLVDGARILCYSPIFCEGTEENPILFHSSDSTSQGLLIIRAGQPSHLSHTIFDYLSCPVDGGWQLPGALTFYESPVNISYCTFSNNQRGDDFLNIIRSDFTMDQVQFKNINADAFDCDFCTGAITNSSFVHIGNDGIDVSGTEMEISHIFMNYIGDKGLSAGEGSQLSARWVEIRNAEIGITSKDRSEATLSDVQLINSRVGIALFQKKSEFGPAYAKVERIEISQSEIPYLIEENSSLIIDGQPYQATRRQVKNVMYGAEYGKSSK